MASPPARTEHCRFTRRLMVHPRLISLKKANPRRCFHIRDQVNRHHGRTNGCEIELVIIAEEIGIQ